MNYNAIYVVCRLIVNFELVVQFGNHNQPFLLTLGVLWILHEKPLTDSPFRQGFMDAFP